MKHYQLSDWVDYVRGVAPEEEQIPMTAHLGRGCRRCLGLARWLTRLNTIAEADACYHMPVEALELACAIYTREWLETPAGQGTRRRGRASTTRALRRTTTKKGEAD